MKQLLLSLDRNQLRTWLADHNAPAFRADQVLNWLYVKKVRNFPAMANLPRDLLALLEQSFYPRAAQVAQISRSADDTAKLLLRWPDAASTETVLIPDSPRNTVCVSSQVGCPVACAFCASGRDGLQRSLEPGEIVEQVLAAADLLPRDERLTHVVVMGLGEPLLNYENTLLALRTLNADWGLGIAARHLTLSTIGLPDAIRRLADEPLQITLAVSIHAPEDRLRTRLIPWAKRYPLADLVAALNHYYRKTHREVTLEYVLLQGVNDTLAHADQLAALARRSRCNVNLINYNPVPEADFLPVAPAQARAFLDQLRRRGANAHLRKSRGRDIDAACGQLRRQPRPSDSRPCPPQTQEQQP